MYKFIILHAERNIIKIIYVSCDLIPLRLVKSWPHCLFHKIQACCRKVKEVYFRNQKRVMLLNVSLLPAFFYLNSLISR